MKLLASFSLSRNHVNSRWLASLCIVESVLLSILHYRFNFWGWPWDKQALIILIIAPGLAYVLQLLLAPVWNEVMQIRLRRWIVFLLPALGIAALAVSQFLVMPETPHHLEIIPSVGDAAGDLQIQEIKGAYGNNVPLSSFAHLPGWTLQGGVLVSRSDSPQPLNLTFAGPIGQQVRVTFLSSPHAGQARVILDGQKVDLALAGPEGNQRRVRLDTQYRWGIFNFLIVPIIVASGLLTVVCLLAVLWLVQEVIQDRRTVSRAASAERFLSHRDSLLLLCALGLVLHAVHFLTIPLVVLKDSPSYLQGAVFWIQQHSLEGVSSYRGPGTTFLFSPFMAPFGRNPWGLKILLHLLAFGCIPLTYRLGWQLGRRRWFAFAVGLLTALLPDLYVYSSYVLSEAPDIFFALLYCTLLISALETLSPSWIVAAALAGSFTVLVRSENLAALAIGLAFLLMRILLLHRTAALPSAAAEVGQPGSSAKLWPFALAVLIAGLPLLAWSVHNQKTYGFFGISDYAGEILYDGWIYYGESSRLAITSQDSACSPGDPCGVSTTIRWWIVHPNWLGDLLFPARPWLR